MTNEEWDAISLLLDKGFKWREPFGEAQAGAYRTLLDGYSAEELLIVIRTLVARGQVFGPTPGEIVALARHDPDRPTFEECYQQLYGPGGIFGIRRTGVVVSPWVQAFADTYGRERIRMLEVNHPQFGDIKRRDLQDAYARFLEASEGREVAQIARSGRGGLGRLDPLEAIRGRATAGALPGGSER